MIVLGCVVDTRKRTLLFGRLMQMTQLNLPSPSTISNYIRDCEGMIEKLYDSDLKSRVNAAIELYIIKPKGEVYRVRKNIYICKNSADAIYVPKIKAKDISLIRAGSTPIIFAEKIMEETDDYSYSSYDILVNYDEYEKLKNEYSGILIGVDKNKVTLDKSLKAYEYTAVDNYRGGVFMKRVKKILRREGEKKWY